MEQPILLPKQFKPVSNRSPMPVIELQDQQAEEKEQKKEKCEAEGTP